MAAPFAIHCVSWQSPQGCRMVTPRLHPGDVAWHPECLCPRPSADSPCSAPLPADLGCRQEAGKLFSLRDVVQHGTVSVKAGWPDEQGSRMGGGGSTEGQHPKDRWETEAWGDQWREQDLPEGLPSPTGLPALPGLLLSWGRGGWEEGGDNLSEENVTLSGRSPCPVGPSEQGRTQAGSVVQSSRAGARREPHPAMLCVQGHSSASTRLSVFV